MHYEVFPPWMVGTQTIPSPELRGLICLLFFSSSSLSLGSFLILLFSPGSLCCVTCCTISENQCFIHFPNVLDF